MRAEIIAIGSELLTPYRIDTNSLYLTEKLMECGIRVGFKTVVGDSKEDIYKALKDSSKRVQMIITTGGLGPTGDDLTREVVSEFLKRELIFREDILEDIKMNFKKRGLRMPDINIRQAFVIEGAEVIKNEVGTAPGMWIEDERIKIAMLPGPPKELKPMVENFLIKKWKNLSKYIFYSGVLRIAGLTESETEERIMNLISGLKNPWITILAIPGQIEINVLSRSENSYEEAKDRAEEILLKIKERLKEYVFAESKTSLEEVVGKMLKEKGKTVSVGESCTAGYLSKRFTDVPGSSNYFIGGVSTYSNSSKMNLLGVKKETLQKYGAVSIETAEEMVKGLFELFKTDYAISITGIAGPEGGTEEKPVGLVYIGIGENGKIEVFKNRFLGDRESIRWQSTQRALYLLWRKLKNGG